MQVVWSWLLEMIELDREVEAEEGARVLTAAGLEVEDVRNIGEDFSGVVVAEVVGSRKHPEADRLTLVELIDRVDGQVTEVVCGAPNVPAAGRRVLWAQPGAVLPGGMKISAREVKGVLSPGMLASERELGLSDEHKGIIVLGAVDGDSPLGTSAGEALRLTDTVFEVSAPANRPDALGHLGIARELAALLGARFLPVRPKLDGLVSTELDANELVTVNIDDPVGCPRYVARVIDGLSVGPSPQWLQQRLRAVGVRPLWNLVDVSNYVMFELGQPLHAFDCGKLDAGRIDVRRARVGERLITLDDIERELIAEDLLICTGDRPVALAGVMGGASTEVEAGTSRVLLESANFEPRSIRRTARRLGLHSESSHRFERHVDPNGAGIAAARAAELLARLGGGRIARGEVDVYPETRTARKVRIRPSQASALTGVDFSAGRVVELLARLDLDPSEVDDDVVEAICPTSRPDLEREVDLIEEVMRLHGFDAVPVTLPRTDVAPAGGLSRSTAGLREALVGAGLSEAITFGFTSPKRVAALNLASDDPRANPLVIRNPMTNDQSVMRTSLLCNLLGAVARNLSFEVTDVALFEIGGVFLPAGDGLPDEPTHVAAVMTGQRPSWLKGGGEIGFFDIKGTLEVALEEILAGEAAQVSFAPAAEVPYLHPGLSARIVLGEVVIGEVGEIHPATRRAFAIDKPCFAFELDLSKVAPASLRKMRAIPRYPSSSRDISFFVDEAVPAAKVAGLIAAAEQPLVENVRVLEDYRHPDKVPTGKKGMLWSITYRSLERTLTDAEVDSAHEAIVDRLLDDLAAERR